MLSRVAESMFWMSRYIERAENTARLLDVNYHLLLDLSQIAPEAMPNYWESLVQVGQDEARFAGIHDHYDSRTVTDFLVFNRENPNSIYSCLALARENARGIIESISSEMWEQVNNLYHYLQRSGPDVAQTDPYNYYKEIRNGSHLFQGITDSTLAHGEGWDFVQAGRYLERADNTARLIDVRFHLLAPPDTPAGAPDVIQWMAVLKSCSALEAFRKVYLANIAPDPILAFLLLDRTFPRSVYFSVAATQDALWRISGSRRRNYRNNADRLVGKLEAELTYTTLEDITRTGLHPYLEDLEHRLTIIGEEIYNVYFAYRDALAEPERDVAADGPTGERAIWSQAQQQQQ